LCNTSLFKSWSDRTIGKIRLQLEVTKEVLHRLEQARDLRPLASQEEALRQLAKLKMLSLASLQRSITLHESRPKKGMHQQNSCMPTLTRAIAETRFELYKWMVKS
jgi:hypothetical protein